MKVPESSSSRHHTSSPGRLALKILGVSELSGVLDVIRNVLIG